MCFHNLKIAVAFLALIALAACGGGGGGSTSSAATGSPATIVADYCGTVTNASSSSSAGSTSSASSSAGTSDSAFTQCKYDVYADGNDAAVPLTGAGAVSNKGYYSQDLNLGTSVLYGAKSTSLSVSDTSTFAVASSGFDKTFSRSNGAFLGLCRSSWDSFANAYMTHMNYVAVAVGNVATKYQAVKVTSAAEMAGVTLYKMEHCSFVDKTGWVSQTSIDASTETLTFNADGSATSAQWGAMSAASVRTIFAGGSAYKGPYYHYGTMYKTMDNGVPSYYFVLRDGWNLILETYVSH